MILAYEFDGASENFAFFLKFYAQKIGLKFSLKKQRDLTTLYAQGVQEELLALSDILASSLPHSVFLRGSKVYAGENLPQGETSEPQNALSNITPSVVSAYLKGELKECENGVFSDVCVFIDGKFTPVTKANFNELLDFAFKNLSAGKSVKFKDISGEFEASNFAELNENFNLLMPTNLKNLPKIFIANEAEQVALASYEKPAVTLKTTAIYRGNHPSSPRFFDACAARDIFIYALCDKLFKAGVNFIALKAQKPPFKSVVLENGYIFSGSRIYYSRSNLNRMEGAADKNLANFNLAKKEFEEEGGIARIFLSRFKDDEVKIYPKFDDFNVLNFALPASFEELYAQIKREEGGERLLQNYGESFSLPRGELNVQNGFFGLFCMVGALLGFDSDAQKAGEILLQNASDFNGAKGPRLDFKMLNKTHFDVVKFARSGMSFRLAGVDARLLSYGYAESLAYFLSDFSDALKQDFSVQNALLCGSLFENKTLANLTLKHLKTGLNAKFSKEFLIEEMF